MLLTQKVTLTLNTKEQIIVGCLSYAATKLWNVANYEKLNYKTLQLEKYPNWYEQKKSLKNHFWYKNLPSQSAQEVLNILEQGWRSFFALLKTHGIANPRPPKFKRKKSNVPFLNNGFKRLGPTAIRLALPKQLKGYLQEKYNLYDNYLLLKSNHFSRIEGTIKQVTLQPTVKGKVDVLITYEIVEPSLKSVNDHYLSIDMGLKNLFTCYDSYGKSFIIKGTPYLTTCHYFNKQIAHYQEIAYPQQLAQGAKYGKSTKRISKLYEKKRKRLNHFFHGATKAIVDYCIKNDIRTVVIGDLKGIRENNNLGAVTNQKFHALPYNKIYQQLSYKLQKVGIALIKQKENYSSQCSPTTPKVNKRYATPSKRTKRGLFKDNNTIYNADSVGAYNILRLYLKAQKKAISIPLKGLSSPSVLKVTV